jgi:hypothetical protein
MAEERIIRSVTSDQAEFATRCTQFLNEEGAFKIGFVRHGANALTLLRQMYRIKVFKLHLKKNKDAAKKFIDELDALGEEIQFFLKGSEKEADPNFLGTPAFKELDNKFDALTANYYTIEMECGV